MKLIVLESSGLVASVAIVEDNKLIGEYTTNFKKTHSQTLLPMLDAVVEMTETDLADVDAIAISGGPGSFTGLRIGSATAKGLGLALNCPIISVPTADAIAYNLYGVSDLICPLMDAKRNQVYTGLYTFEEGEFKVLCPQKAVGIEEIVAEINATGRPCVFLGDGVPVYKDYIDANLNLKAEYAPLHLTYQRAGAVGALAKVYFEAGKIQTAVEHKPEYLRLSQAERERAAQLAAQQEQ